LWAFSLEIWQKVQDSKRKGLNRHAGAYGCTKQQWRHAFVVRCRCGFIGWSLLVDP
jgi:hypothetical protein